MTYICHDKYKKKYRTYIYHSYIKIIGQIFVIDKYKANTVGILTIDWYIKKACEKYLSLVILKK